MERINTVNVLCVSKRDTVNGAASWHNPIKGKATITTVYENQLGIEIAKTTVCFKGVQSDLIYVREGLDGLAATIVIKRNDYPYNVWELYTDTPISDSTTVEDIWRVAEKSCAKHT